VGFDGWKHTDATKERIAESARTVWRKPEMRDVRRRARLGWRHSDETKKKMTIAHNRRMATDPTYRATRKRVALIATQAARAMFLSALSEAPLTKSEIPLTKGDAAVIRSLPCALCRTTERPRELAHMRARSQGGPPRHVWGNVIPLCEPCHRSTDWGKLPEGFPVA
jgi:5-methylcytosine-specific restriction endonuclease McrA